MACRIPARPAPDASGAGLFDSVGCAVCHVPTLRTRADWPTPQLASIDAPVFTDLLLHDMGADLADGQEEEGAGPREFRTAPLIGRRFLPAYLHDGRAATLRDAVLGHRGPGSEAGVVIERFEVLGTAEQDALLCVSRAALKRRARHALGPRHGRRTVRNQGTDRWPDAGAGNS